MNDVSRPDFLAAASAARMGDLVAAMTGSELRAEIAQPKKLILDRHVAGARTIETVWAPFDHINDGAAVCIVGITPGRQQMEAALVSYHAARSAGRDHQAALAAAKVHASFAGPLRDHLVQMLDHVGVNRWLGLASTVALWDTRPDLAHFTSALRHPVFVDEANYSGRNPAMLRTAPLRRAVETTLVDELTALPARSIIVPLGPKVDAAVLHAAEAIPGFDRRRIMCGLPHPSPGNRGQIYPFLGLPGRPGRTQPVPASIGERRDALLAQVQSLGLRKEDAPT